MNVRMLLHADLSNPKFFECLETLHPGEKITLAPTDARKIFVTFRNCDMPIFVLTDSGRDDIVATASLLIEHKFIHNGGIVGHIEDVAVHPTRQKQGLGAMLVQSVITYAKEEGCYKVILDCSDEVKPFYEKLGFITNGNHMRLDLCQDS